MKPSEIITPDEIVAAATMIVQYCNDGDERTNCQGCVFSMPDGNYGERCGLIDLPEQWKLQMFRDNARRAEHG